MKNILELIDNLIEASEEHAWLGSKPPEEWNEIKVNLNGARGDVLDWIKVNCNNETKEQQELSNTTTDTRVYGDKKKLMRELSVFSYKEYIKEQTKNTSHLKDTDVMDSIIEMSKDFVQKLSEKGLL